MEVKKTVLINADKTTVWNYLTVPDLMKTWMGEPEMDIEVFTNWEQGSAIIIKGFHHEPFDNKGFVLQFIPNEILQYSHLSSVSQLPDSAGNYSVITFSLRASEERTLLMLEVTNFPTEIIYRHLDLYWKTTCEILKKLIEGKA